MGEHENRVALDRHWAASASGDQEAEHDIYVDDSICDYPQSAERIVGRRNLQALRSHHPGKTGEDDKRHHPRLEQREVIADRGDARVRG